MKHVLGMSLLGLCVGLASCSERKPTTSTAPAPTPMATQTSALSILRTSPAYSRVLSTGLALHETVDGWSVTRTQATTLSHVSRSLDRPTRIESRNGGWVDVQAADVDNVAAELSVDAVVFHEARPHTDLIQLARPDGFEELRWVRQAAASIEAQYVMTLGPGLARLRASDGLIEALDNAGRAWLRSPTPYAVDARGVRRDATVTLKQEGAAWRVSYAIDGGGLVAPIALDPGWFETTNMINARTRFTSTPLADGRVLVAGGTSDGTKNSALSSAEILDPAAHTWTAAASMGTARAFAGAAKLAGGSTGSVLVSGGANGTVDNLSTAEIWNGTTWTAATAMQTGRANHVLVAISGTKALAMGGAMVSNAVGLGEIYDTSTTKWTSPTGSVSGGAARQNAAYAVQPTSGKVVVSGAAIYNFCPGISYFCTYGWTDIFDPTVGAWSPGPTMVTARQLHAMVALPDGRMVAIGGQTYSGKYGSTAVGEEMGTPISTVEILSNTLSGWTSAAPLPTSRERPAAASLLDATGTPTGQVIVAGGFDDAHNPVAPVLSFDGTTGGTAAWSAFGTLSIARAEANILPYGTGNAFVFGGTITSDKTFPGGTTASTEMSGAALVTRATCTNNGNCASGYCVDGYCCDKPCTGACEACNVTGVQGICTNVTGHPVGSRSCSGSSECASTCTGADNACHAGTTTTPCGASACAGFTLTGLGTCSGDASNTCNPGTAKKCAGDLMCATDGVHCLTKCAGDLDCAPGKVCNTTAGTCVTCVTNAQCTGGQVCDTTSGTCVAPAPDAGPDAAPEVGADAAPDAASDAPAADALISFDGASPTIPSTPTVSSFQRCVHDSECSSGHCVEGVCCDTACTDRCHSCALLNSPGKCTQEPAGVDLRNECGAADTCTGTCGGNGDCIGAGPGSMCARNVCTDGAHGVGPAYCASAGAPCSNAAVTSFDCTPYACAPAFGACVTSCANSTDCANGYTCDTASKTCLAAAVKSGGGCAVTMGAERGRGASRAMAALLLAAGVLAIRRRRSHAR